MKIVIVDNERQWSKDAILLDEFAFAQLVDFLENELGLDMEQDNHEEDHDDQYCDCRGIIVPVGGYCLDCGKEVYPGASEL
jgi:hypothetical protein